jgi:hypothetical protein
LKDNFAGKVMVQKRQIYASSHISPTFYARTAKVVAAGITARGEKT